jgi:hypothetical protein
LPSLDVKQLLITARQKKAKALVNDWERSAKLKITVVHEAPLAVSFDRNQLDSRVNPTSLLLISGKECNPRAWLCKPDALDECFEHRHVAKIVELVASALYEYSE